MFGLLVYLGLQKINFSRKKILLLSPFSSSSSLISSVIASYIDSVSLLGGYFSPVKLRGDNIVFGKRMNFYDALVDCCVI